MKKSRLLIAALVLVLVLCYISSSWNYDHRLFNAIGYLSLARETVNWYKEQTGTYPKAIRDVSSYAKQHKMDVSKSGAIKVYLFSPDTDFERISDPKGNNTEHDRLNNLGGFYYNKATGEVNLNLTEPLWKYFPFYFGNRRNSIPANW